MSVTTYCEECRATPTNRQVHVPRSVTRPVQPILTKRNYKVMQGTYLPYLPYTRFCLFDLCHLCTYMYLHVYMYTYTYLPMHMYLKHNVLEKRECTIMIGFPENVTTYPNRFHSL